MNVVRFMQTFADEFSDAGYSDLGGMTNRQVLAACAACARDSTDTGRAMIRALGSVNDSAFVGAAFAAIALANPAAVLEEGTR